MDSEYEVWIYAKQCVEEKEETLFPVGVFHGMKYQDQTVKHQAKAKHSVI